jgi:hypothetical protein
MQAGPGEAGRPWGGVGGRQMQSLATKRYLGRPYERGSMSASLRKRPKCCIAVK